MTKSKLYTIVLTIVPQIVDTVVIQAAKEKCEAPFNGSVNTGTKHGKIQNIFYQKQHDELL